MHETTRRPAKANMAVTATFVFACEAHREAWLLDNGLLDDGPFPEAKKADYDARKDSQSLFFMAAACPADEIDAAG